MNIHYLNLNRLHPLKANQFFLRNLKKISMHLLVFTHSRKNIFEKDRRSGIWCLSNNNSRAWTITREKIVFSTHISTTIVNTDDKFVNFSAPKIINRQM